jgi:hypothetical protein
MKGRFAGSVVAGVAVSLALAAPAAATDFPVTNTADSGEGSLRDAVGDANANSGADSISFTTTGTITLTTGQLGISGPVDINGPGPESLTVSGNDSSRIFAIGPVGDPGVQISGLRLTAGQPVDTCSCGGAILNFQTDLVVENSILDHNDAAWGGAIESYQGELDVSGSIINDNTASHDFGGGGIHSDSGDADIAGSMVLDNSTQGSGGGMALYGGKYTVKDSTVARNHSDDNDGGISTGNGKLTVTNSTITANDTGGYGGGIGNTSKLKVKSCTVAGNEANRGGGMAGDAKKQSVTNSIIADNIAIAKGPDMFGKFKLSYSLLESKQKAKVKGKRNIFKQDPVLDVLDGNGGFTHTMALLEGSPAIDEASKKTSPDLDQRGEQRDNKPDMGAYEVVD